jgi:hypothetical protein
MLHKLLNLYEKYRFITCQLAGNLVWADLATGLRSRCRRATVLSLRVLHDWRVCERCVLYDNIAEQSSYKNCRPKFR